MIGQKLMEMKGVLSPLNRVFSLFFFFSLQTKHLPTLTQMASLSRSFASAIVNRTYVNVPASSNAVKRIFHASSSSEEEHHESHNSQPLLSTSTKQRSVGGLVNKSNVNGKQKKKNSLPRKK
jgi:hypothetical protein